MNSPGRPPLLSLDDALAQLLATAAPLGRAEQVPTMEADGRVLAQDVVSELQVPAHDNSAMDGYAIRCADVMALCTALTVSQRIAAGGGAEALTLGTAARIFTGAVVPAGADAVVMQEDCTAVAAPDGQGTASQVIVNQPPTPGQNIRRAGEDVSRDAVVLSRGQRLGPAELGLAASIGMASLSVARRPRVALFSTGDELVMPGTRAPQDMQPGAIYNSNRFFLSALLRRMGAEVTDLGIVPDKLDATVAALRDAAAHHDLILTSGGVSVGEEDHIKPAVQALGQLDLWQIAIKPGKPFAHGRIHTTARSEPPVLSPVEGVEGLTPASACSAGTEFCHFIGLPGNPVSSFVTFLLLVRPFLQALQGQSPSTAFATPVRADFAWPKADRRREFLRVRRNAAGGLDLFPNQSSGVLTSAVWGDGVVDNPSGQTIAPGDTVQFLSFADLLS
ncbi:MAG: molybdopterin molybdenumtransferase MoeA [Comamonadaceae bacterium PBBC2]|nr:MAG: molybdopterin molybdenumtransferase MoeA [Comamonadaceae bacterium PBBC2]